MRKNLEKPANISPAPVLVIATYNEDGSANIMNAAWGTMQAPDHVALNLAKPHKTTENIEKRRAFTVSFADADHVESADFVGLTSGNKIPDKAEKSGFSVEKSEVVDAPIISDLPICLECEFVEYQENEYGMGVIGKIVNTSVDEKILSDGAIDMARANLILFDPLTMGYYRVGERVANAFNVGKKLIKG
ncbi:MAG: flavin reductase family protein [Peptoniphilus sp.]|nr:flavin reductase family protein [Peptoniphilus sp.]MDD7363298.1 flavin reductase family protein [Bacillota bacterium]MDY6045393.1 flavin reductase family protein [Peptoniphilus sp.]